MNIFIQSHKEEFTAATEHLKNEFKSIRTGQANPELLDGVQVSAYESMMPLKQVATITAPDSKTIAIQPFDKAILKEIEKSIIAANLGFSPVVDSDMIRVPMPPMTEENRKDLVKLVSQKTEKSRVVVRGLRDKVKDVIQKAEANKEISEDEKFKALKELDQFTASTNEEIKQIAQKKEEQIMTI